MNVPFLDLKKQYVSLKEEFDEAIFGVIKSGNFIMGDTVSTFEKEVGNYIGTKVVSCASGSDALFICLKAAGIEEGDEVITSPFTFFATAGAVVRAGGTPVFVDTKKDTHNINADLVEEKITEKTKAIIPVHIFGLMADMDKIMEISKKHDLFVIEDACQAIGAKEHGKNAGSIGDFGTFSFFPTKNLGGYGDGGLISVKGDDHYEYVKKFRVHGASKKYFHDFVGINSRLDALQAAILNIKLKYIDKWNNRRKQIAKVYNEGLKDIVSTPVEPENKYHIYHQYSITTDDRDGLKEFLKNKGVASGIYYPLPLHLQKCFENLGYKQGNLPNAENSSKSILSLPIFPEMTDSQIQFVINSVVEYLK